MKEHIPLFLYFLFLFAVVFFCAGPYFRQPQIVVERVIERYPDYSCETYPTPTGCASPRCAPTPQ